MKKETIYLAGGCFWGTEKYMETVPGVLSTRVGYALGKQKGVEQKVWDTVTYEEVCNHSGHAETVEIVFDADETTLTNILQDFFYTIDPTSLGRQGGRYWHPVPHRHLQPDRRTAESGSRSIGGTPDQIRPPCGGGKPAFAAVYSR